MPSPRSNEARETLPKGARLRRRREFLAVQGEGKKLQTSSFLVFVRLRRAGASLSPARLGITVSKKVGSAVERNRIKRLVREVFRRHKAFFPEGLDVVFVAKRAAVQLAYEQVNAEVEKLCERYFQR